VNQRRCNPQLWVNQRRRRRRCRGGGGGAAEDY